MNAASRFVLFLVLATILACAAVMAIAQPVYTFSPACLPAATMPPLTTPLPVSTPMRVTYNAAGVCVRWDCVAEGSFTTPTYCGTWATQHLVGARVQTIQKAADPLRSLQTIGSRIPVVPLSDPGMAGMPK